MTLRNLASAFENESPCGMQPSKIRSAASFIGPFVGEHPTGLAEKLARFCQKSSAFRFHKSIPSARISNINGVRSMYDPAL
jgi:hypothetical protein